MFKLGSLSVGAFATDFDFLGKTFLICDQNLSGVIIELSVMLSLSAFIVMA